MAKQVIGVGAAANDGTGDPLRNAMVKINANFTELYNGQFSGAYADLTGKPTIPTDLTDLGITDGTSNQVLTTDGAGNFTFRNETAGSGGIDLTDLSVTVAAAGSANLAYNNGTGVFTFTPPNLSSYALSSAIPTDLTDLGIIDGTNGQVLTTNGAGGFTFTTVSGGGSGLQSRGTVNGTTASLASNATGNLNITGFKSYALMAIQTDRAAWVRIYANGASRTSDASRTQTTDPAPDAGVIAEVITTGAQTVLISPGVFGFNFEGTPTTNIPCAVTNLSGSTSTVVVTLSVLQLEA
jgi:hypothetical protein